MTVVPFALIWALAWGALSVSTLLAVALASLNAGFLVRIFMIQHDCSHGSFLKNRRLGDWIGRALGILTLTPFDVWRKNHATHHGSTGNLDRRGVGDIPTLTVQEYKSKNWIGRFLYRLVRNPIFLFGVAPFYTFFLENRLPIGLMQSGWRYWVSSQVTNAAIGGLLGLLLWFGGAQVIAFIFVPTTLLAASIGMWLFYVQHQFEHTTWKKEEDWDLYEAALHGSSHYVLPGILRWFTGNIGIHHVHHLASRIPFYRLSEVLSDFDELNRCQRITLWESLRSTRLHLWDEQTSRLVSFSEARAASV